jgi:hypothetical protein
MTNILLPEAGYAMKNSPFNLDAANSRCIIQPSSLLNNPKKRRGRTSAWQRVPGLQDFQENRRICRPGAPTGRFHQQSARCDLKLK